MTGTRFSLEVRPVIPGRLGRLEELANDLLYSWDSPVRGLFVRLDPELWERCGHNPKVFLRRISEHILETAGVPFDDGAREAEQNFMKLLASRSDLVILPENDGLELLRDPKWADKIEMLAPPFVSQEFYLGFSRSFYRSRPAVADAFWRAIGEIRNSREYRQAVSRATP